ncbi:hypothetical protein HMPREF0372_01140 [Flavonifractor plautii ATCC 29863]|uniref:Uncharacterized protein n=1 Tax=Flavonifractor plautii ATCC 29863 TaxID=411475 RepID=G9YNR3_FLAPL|nr:hypothetical protein HMPREF0372_01140 [Flavonifractor plautii ATCC 29863]
MIFLLACPGRMLICHKVTNKNLIDSSPLFRVTFFVMCFIF